MGTTAQKLQAIANSKTAIKAAIEAKGVQDVGDVLSTYPQKISEIEDTRCGYTIGNFVGTVENGHLSLPPTGSHAPRVFDGTGIYSMGIGALRGKWVQGGNLVSLYFPDLTAISNYGFERASWGNTALSVVNFPNVQTIGVRGMNLFAFKPPSDIYQPVLTTFNMPNLKEVGQYGLSAAFENTATNGFNNIHLEKLERVQDYGMARTFYETRCSHMEFPELVYLGRNAMEYLFRGNTALKRVEFDKLGYTGDNAGLRYAFYGCTGLSAAIFPELSSVGPYGLQNAFYNDTSLKEMNLSSVTSAGNYGLSYTFYGCNKLEKVYLNRLSSAGSNCLNYTFSGCTRLQLVDFSEATAVPSMANTTVFSNTNTTYKIVVPDALYDKWIAAANWNNTNIKSHIVKVSDYTYT